MEYAVGAVFGREGFGYLKKQAQAFNHAAKHCPFLLLADLDQSPCPPQLIADWLKRPRHPHLLLRVAVREVESWLLGDCASISAFLSLKKKFVCGAPEQRADPKDTLLKLAMSSPRRSMRDAIVWQDDSNGKLYQGPDYNAALAQYVGECWDIQKARIVCRSLGRFFVALERFGKRI